MMNILYIGPYRQIDYIGQVSRLHIESISSKLKPGDNLITRSVYLDASLSNAQNVTIRNEEIPNISNLDLIVQYLPLECMAIDPTVKNIAIPIIDARISDISNNYSYKILNYFNNIFVDDDKQKNLLRSVCIDKKIDLYEERIIDTKKQKFNLLSEDPSIYKFGFVGQYATNKKILQQIITSFLISTKIYDKIKLFLFLRGSDSDKQDISSFISNAKKQLRLPEYINKIETIYGMWGQDEAIAAINSVDSYISLNEDYRYTFYEKYFSSISNDSQNQKFLISRNNLSMTETPVVSTNNINEHMDWIGLVSTKDLIQKISSAPSTKIQKHRKNEYQNIGEQICKLLV